MQNHEKSIDWAVLCVRYPILLCQLPQYGTGLMKDCASVGEFSHRPQRIGPPTHRLDLMCVSLSSCSPTRICTGSTGQIRGSDSIVSLAPDLVSLLQLALSYGATWNAESFENNWIHESESGSLPESQCAGRVAIGSTAPLRGVSHTSKLAKVGS